MPAFSFHRPRFLRFCRSSSRSPKASPADARDDTAVSPSPCLDSSRASSSRPSFRFGSLAQDVRAATSNSRPSAPGTPNDPENPTGRLLVNRMPDDFGGQPSRPVTPIGGIVPSNAVNMLSSHSSVVRQATHLASPSNHTDFVQAQHLLASPPLPYILVTSSQQSFNSEPPIPPSGQDSPQQQHQNQGMFNRAQNFSATGPFVDGNVGSITYNNTTSNQFMEKLLEKTIPGAEFDSSDRDPPPRCHPGTRLDILDRCLDFIHNCDGKKKIRWLVGAAGVGKSAIMQNVAESPELPVTSHASVFFSIKGRNDGTKVIITISYQLAAKSKLYRQLIKDEITHDPSLLRSSMAKQFLELIVKPFIGNAHLNSAGRVLIIIDGLDECNDPRTQEELLRLISDFCIKYPSSPLVWLIASRPETHITSFFSRVNVMPAYEKEEIPVDSDKARADVERFLRHKLKEIKDASDSLDPHSEWPEERHSRKLANASGGLFAYADTVIRYIGDSNIGNPVSQLSDVLNVIDNYPVTGNLQEEHPMALLDTLYARILSNVPPKNMKCTRKLLLALTSDWQSVGARPNFIQLCNWLTMTPDEAYAAVNHLRSVLRIPKRDKAYGEKLEPFHKSFIDYISEFTRSEFSRDIAHEAQQLMTKCASRTLKEAPDGIDFGDVDYQIPCGILMCGPGTGDKISLTWMVGEKGGRKDNATRLNVYKLAMEEVVAGVGRGDPIFQNVFCVRLLTTQLEGYYGGFPFSKLRKLLFDESRRNEFMMDGILKQVPLEAVDILTISGEVELRFRRPATTLTNLSDPWHSSCEHEREGEWERGKDQDWKTTFRRYGYGECILCYDRLQLQLEWWKTQWRNTRSLRHTVPGAFTSAEYCSVEVQFVDREDGMSEWTYWFWFKLSSEKRKKYEALYHI